MRQFDNEAIRQLVTIQNVNMRTTLYFLLFMLLFNSCKRRENIKTSISGSLYYYGTNTPCSTYLFRIIYLSERSSIFGGTSPQASHETIQTDSLGKFQYSFRISPRKNKKSFTLIDTNESVILETENTGELGIIYKKP